MKRITTALFLCMLLAVPLTIEAQGADAQEKPRWGGTIKVAYPWNPRTWYPLKEPWTTVGGISVLTNHKLIRFEQGWVVAPELAESWETNKEGTWYRFKLRKGVKWHDGMPFTSADVKWWYDFVYSQARAGAPSGTLGRFLVVSDLISVDAPDEYTVEFRFKKTFQLWVFASVHIDRQIQPKHLYAGLDADTMEKKMNEKHIGTGPFKLVEFVVGSHAIVEANPDYYGGRPYLDRVIFRIGLTPETAIAAFEKGEIDSIQGDSLLIPPSEIPRLKKIQGITADAWPEPGMHVRLVFTNKTDGVAKSPWVRDIRVRQAVELAIDKESIVRDVLYGVTVVATGPWSGIKDFYWTNVNLKPSEYNPAKAEQLLEEAGYKKGSDGMRLRITAVASQAAPNNLLFEPLTEMLKKVGIELKWTIMEHGSYLTFSRQYGQGDYALNIGWGSTGPDPESPRSMYTSLQLFENSNGYLDPQVSELFDKAGQMVDPVLRKPLYDKVQEIIMESHYFIPLFPIYRMEAWRDTYQGIRESNRRPIYYIAGYGKVWWTGGSDVSPEGAAKAIADADAKIKDLKGQGYDVAASESKLKAARDAYAKQDYAGAVSLAAEAVKAAVAPPPYTLYISVAAIIAIVIGVLLYRRKKKT